MRFALSTHVFHDVRLTRDHLRLAAEAGFEAIELFASRAHVDYHDAASVAALAGWLRETGLGLASVHAPIAAGLAEGRWRQPWSNAAADASARELAVRETGLALEIARTVPFETLVLHVGVPVEHAAPGGDNQRDAARRSLEAIAGRAAELDVELALEVIPNDLSSPGALVRLLDSDIELGRAGVCLDFGHAHLLGDVVEAIETLSGYVVATHVHDNHGRHDDHLMPFDGSIDWDSAMLALRKVGYDGRLTFELAGAADPPGVLARAAAVRRRLDTLAAADGHA